MIETGPRVRAPPSGHMHYVSNLAAERRAQSRLAAAQRPRPPTQRAAPEGPVCEYERQRRENIAANQIKLAELGLI